MKGEPDVIRATVVPMLPTHTAETVAEDLTELDAAGLVHQYEVADERYLSFPGFGRNQKIRRGADGKPTHEAESSIPPPPEDDGSTTVVRLSADGSTTAQGKLKKGKERRATQPEPEHLRLAERLRDRILETKPDFKTPGDLSSWAADVSRMIQRDGRAPERIAEVVDWAQRDEFWRGNILSVASLRKQFDRLEMQMTRNGKRPEAFPLERVIERPNSEVERLATMTAEFARERGAH